MSILNKLFGIRSEPEEEIETVISNTVKDDGEPLDSPGGRRVIKTARTLESINEAAKNGFRPLIKPVIPSEDIHLMVAVFQNPETGIIQLSTDYRMHPDGVLVMGFTHYYPYRFPNPFAAYLIPNDLAVGEFVWLEDLIEDLVAAWGNQGHHPRLPAGVAIWNGRDFEILFDPERDAAHWIG